jgi:predicted nucleic acid-binding protein
MYRRRTQLVAPATLSGAVCRDPDDDHVLAAALGASADLILTGDKDLLVLRVYQGIRIRSPRQFADAPLA